MSFITEIGKWIKGWRLDKFFKGVANGDKDEAKKLEQNTETAVRFVEHLKEQIKGAGGLVTAVIPGDWDNVLVAKAETFLEAATANSGLVTECASKPTPGEQLACTYSKIAASGNEFEEDNFWRKLGTLATMIFADGKITFGDAGVAAEFVYRLIVKKKPVTI